MTDKSSNKKKAAPIAAPAAAADNGAADGGKAVAKKATRIGKPDKNQNQLLIDSIQAEIDALTEDSKGIKIQIDSCLSDRSGSKGELDIAKSQWQALTTSRKTLMNERATFMAARDATWEKIKARSDELKSLTSDLKFNSIASIDAQIRELENKQARTTMSLNDEKKVIKEIAALQKSKKVVASVADMKESIERDKAIKAGLEKSVTDKNAELKVINDAITAHKVVLDALNKDNADQLTVVPALKSKIAENRDKINERYARMKAVKAEFKVAEDAYYASLAEERTRKREEEKLAAEKLRAEWEEQKKKEAEEELKRIPYEEEINLCDFLIQYLQTKLLNSHSGDASASKTAAAAADPAVLSERFAGLKLMVRSQDEYLAPAVTKQAPKKRAEKNNHSRETVVHTVDTLTSFSHLEVAPPNSLSTVATAVLELQAKKAFYQSQERGAVPTIADKVKAERAPAAAAAVVSSKPAAKTVFSLENDFPAL